jgi:hypothetical protein
LNFSYLELPESGNNALAFLTAREFFNVNGVKTRMELELDYNLTLSLQGYADLVRCLNYYVGRLKPNDRNNRSNTSILAEFGMLKKPGKKIRTALVKKKRGKNLNWLLRTSQ